MTTLTRPTLIDFDKYIW